VAEQLSKLEFLSSLGFSKGIIKMYFFRHVMVGANDLDESKKFYDALFGVLGVPSGKTEGEKCRWLGQGGQFLIKLPINGEPATNANGGTIGFNCSSKAMVDQWYAAGMSNGGISITPPKLDNRGVYKLYLSYIRDPVGNKLNASYQLPKEGTV
tara:strand:- start:681 stop:1142 length:462 start_codon:yes stop_codon:yes gene_type:complete